MQRRRRCLAAVAATSALFASVAPTSGSAWVEGLHGSQRQAGLCRRWAGEAAAAGFEERREALKQCLAREYKSFFNPFEADFYTEDVTFQDPLNMLRGKDKYRGNVEMLSGKSLVGNILFSDGFIDLHGVEDVPGDRTKLRTRWTLGFAFKLLPWKPRALFSGVSEYTIDPSTAKVIGQRDFWDTLSLGKDGGYSPEPPFAGVSDLVSQLLPSPLQPVEVKEPLEGYALLRRARAYRIYRDGNTIFAVPIPKGTSLTSLRTELEAHGLVPGSAITKPGVGDCITLERPHPWEEAQVR